MPPIFRPLKRAFERFGGAMGSVLVALRGTNAGVVLAYHSISTGDWIHAVDPVCFEAQLQWLSRHAEVVSLAELEERLLTKQAMRCARPLVAITFDDGYADWVQTAKPLLEKYHMPATFFVSTAFEAATMRADHEGVVLLSSRDVVRLAGGRFEVGAHGHKHMDLLVATRSETTHELEESKRLLESWTKQPVVRMSYPKNRYRPETIALVQAAGYEAAYAGNGTVTHGNNRFTLGRVTITKDITRSRFAAKFFLAYLGIF